MNKKNTIICSFLCFCGCIRGVDLSPADAGREQRMVQARYREQGPLNLGQCLPETIESLDAARCPIIKNATTLCTHRVDKIETLALHLRSFLKTLSLKLRGANDEDIMVNSRDMLFLITVEHLGRFYDALDQMIWDLDECQFHIERCGVTETAIKREKTQVLDTLSHAIKTVKKSIDSHTKQSLSSTLDHTNTIIDAISDVDIYYSKDKNGIKAKRKKNVIFNLKKEKQSVASGLNTVRFDIQQARRHLNYHKFINKLTNGWISVDILLKNHGDLKTANKEQAKNGAKSKECVDLTTPLIHQCRDIFHQTLKGFELSIEKSIGALDKFLNTVNPLKHASMDCNKEPLCFVNLSCRYPPNKQVPAASGLIPATAPILPIGCSDQKALPRLNKRGSIFERAPHQ
jgi:hypothetical protein